MTTDPKVLGFIRALGVAVVMAILSFLGDAAHLSGIVSQSVAGIIAALALAAEHSMEAKGNGALFGAVRSPLGSNKIPVNKVELH